LGGVGRVLDAGEAFAAGNALGAGDGFGVNQPADAGPETRAKAAIRAMRANMKEAELAIKEMLDANLSRR
jgi:hypothetical protein